MIYLDNAATTKPSDAALEKYNEVSRNCFGNTASLHTLGTLAEKELSRAREIIATTIGASADEIYFTSGGTEGNNIAVLGAARACRGGKVLTSGYEHASVFEAAKNCGLEHAFVDADSNGADALAFGAAAENTAVASIMLVNNETGLISPLPEIAAQIKSKSPRAVIHSDAVQAYGKIPFSVNGLCVDMLTASAHKIGGVKGAGMLYIRRGTRLEKTVFGGGHEKGVRSGTVNLAAIAAFAVAAQAACDSLKENYRRVKALREHADRCLSKIREISFAKFPEKNLSPYIETVFVGGMRGETVLHYLSDRGIYVSTGSACHSNSKGDRRVLEAQGISVKAAESALRISYSPQTSEEEIEELARGIESACRELSRGVRI